VTIFICNFILITLPVLLGRYAIASVVRLGVSDIYAFFIGMYLLCGTGWICKIVAESVTSNAFADLIVKIKYWGTIVSTFVRLRLY
jgi:hypothetical protein